MGARLQARGMLAAGALIGLLAVAGCGGGDDDSDPQQVISEASPGVVEVVGKAGDETFGGSGFIYDAGPPVRILTNSHVIEGLSSIQVKIGDQLPTVSAQVLGRSFEPRVRAIEPEAVGRRFGSHGGPPSAGSSCCSARIDQAATAWRRLRPLTRGASGSRRCWRNSPV
jgi:S1-C subfamily serine protease